MISFEHIPAALRDPGAYAEFDNSRATRGLLQAFEARILVIGQMTSAGTATAATPLQILTPDAAAKAFGPGSMLHRMFEMIVPNNGFTETVAVALADDGAGTAAAGAVEFTGDPTASGTAVLRIGGRLVRFAVAASDDATDAADAFRAACGEVFGLPVVATGSTATATLTARNKGENGNGIGIEVVSLPAGLGATVTAMNSGDGNPDIADAIAAVADEAYTFIICPYTDSTSISALTDWLEQRWQPLAQKEGQAFTALVDSVANLSTYGNALNSPLLSVLGVPGTSTPAEEVAAAYGAVAAYHLNIDPARPLHTLQLRGVAAPAEADRLTQQERNILLYDGIAVPTVTRDGRVLIGLAVTTYQTNASDVADESYLKVNTIATLTYLRQSWRQRMLQVFPRHKLRGDGTNIGSFQAIATPRMIAAECDSLFLQWEAAGLVEDFEQWKRDRRVEINASNPNRVDLLLPPNIVNQLDIFAAKFQFLL